MILSEIVSWSGETISAAGVIRSRRPSAVDPFFSLCSAHPLLHPQSVKRPSKTTGSIVTPRRLTAAVVEAHLTSSGVSVVYAISMPAFVLLSDPVHTGSSCSIVRLPLYPCSS